MNTITIPHKKPNKHLDLIHYETIIREIIKHDASSLNKKRNTGKTVLIKHLASEIGTSVSNIYSILHDATISIKNYDLTDTVELSALAAFNKRSKNHKIPNNSKLLKAQPFIQLVEKEMKSNNLSSVDETIQYLKLHCPDLIAGKATICTSTFYHYIHQNKVSIKPLNLPRMASRKIKKDHKSYIPKNQKGTSIEQRPQEIESREEFGHWEGDLVVGPREASKGAYLTLIERKTRFYYMLPISSKSSKKVLMQINKLNKFYMEKKPGTKNKRTSIYFAHPYCSCERGSNENCNGLLRYFIKKGTDINSIPKEITVDINNKINLKKRKILGYLPAESLFLNELAQLNVTNNTIFYKD